MASISLFSVGKTILEKLGPLVQQEAALLWNLQTELKKLEGTVTAIQALLLDAEEQQAHSHQVKDWLEKLEVLLFDAEELLDDVATEALRMEAASRDQDNGDDGDDEVNCRVRCWDAVCFLFISVPNRLIYGLKMAHKVKSLREQLDVIHDDNTKLLLTPRFEEKGKLKKHSHSISSIPDIVVGREDDLKHIKEILLTDNVGNSNFSVVSVVGIGGMGKTALAQLVYNNRQVNEHFKLRLWACVSESFGLNVIIQKILGHKQDLELEILANQLLEHIRGKKCFLVLDDVWNFDPEGWDKLRSVLRSGARGSKILVTTRFENYARMMSRGSTEPPYALSGLSSPQSWSLFRQVVFGGEEHCLGEEEPQNITNVEEIKIEIMKKSAGVPLAVKTIANLLCFKDPQTEWLPFLRSNKLLSANHENSLLHNLKLSYNYLPPHLKRCFAFCSLYPKDHEFLIISLIHLWVALGFVKSSPCDSEEESLFDLGLQYFMDLAWRSFFQEIKRDWSNNMKSCKMHDLMHDLAVSVAGSGCKEITSPAIEISEKTRHILLYHALWSPSDLIGHLNKAQRLQTFYVRFKEWYESDTSWDDATFKTFVLTFQSLRVLDFVNCGMEILPLHIHKLKHLRYLDMSCNDEMTRLPQSITMLQNLQVLILHTCKSLRELPKDINKLVNLWILDCTHCFALTHMPVGLGELTRLETLSWFVVGKDSSASSKHIGGLNELNKLNKLLGFLRIVNLGHLRSSTYTLSPPSLAFEIGAAANLKGKLHLEDLALHWDDAGSEKSVDEWVEECLKSSVEDVEWDENLLESLQPHPNLKVVGVSEYKGRRCPSWISSLTHLLTLSLFRCKVRHGLHHLQGLPSLQRLNLIRLIEADYMDEDEDELKAASKPFFPSLQKLKLVSCPKLKGWQKRNKSSQFPKLSKLTVMGCPLLTSMPLFPTLDTKLELMDTSLQPLLHTMNISSCPSSSEVLQYPLCKLKKLHIYSIDGTPKEWLQGMEHLTSLEEIKIEDCSGLEETLDWHNISHVPEITIDRYYINRDGQCVWDEYGWNNFQWILQYIRKAEEEAKGENSRQ